LHIYANIAEVYSAMSLFRRDNRADTFAKAIANYNLALQKNPYESDFMYKKALLLKRIGKYDEANELFNNIKAILIILGGFDFITCLQSENTQFVITH